MFPVLPATNKLETTWWNPYKYASWHRHVNVMRASAEKSTRHHTVQTILFTGMLNTENKVIVTRVSHYLRQAAMSSSCICCKWHEWMRSRRRAAIGKSRHLNGVGMVQSTPLLCRLSCRGVEATSHSWVRSAFLYKGVGESHCFEFQTPTHPSKCSSFFLCS